jgi:hypothetical protein
MKGKILFFFLIFVISIIFSSQVYASEPAHDHNRGKGYLGMFISDFQTVPNPPRSNEKANFSLIVENSYEINEQINEVPIDGQVIVLITAQKEGKTLKKSAKFKGKGIFEGTLTFSEAGKWDILIKGVRNNHGSVSNAEYVTSIEVEEGEKTSNSSHYFMYWGIGFFIIMLMIAIWKKTPRKVMPQK